MNLDPLLCHQIINIASQYPHIQKVILFGSRARHDNSERSDIDLAVFATDSILSFIDAINNETTTLLEYDITHITSETESYFLDEINKEGITLYEKTSI